MNVFVREALIEKVPHQNASVPYMYVCMSVTFYNHTNPMQTCTDMMQTANDTTQRIPVNTA